jgi:hypothetical protein
MTLTMTETVSQAAGPWDEEVDRLRKELDVENKTAMYHIDRGRQGLNAGVANGMTVLNKFLYGTQRARYYLIGADSGVGKTTLTDFMYVYNLFVACEALSIPFEILYFSFEISVVMKKARWISMLYYLKYNEDIPSDAIYGWSPNHLLTDDQYAKVKIVAAEVERMFSHIQFVETAVTPFRMFDMIVHRAGAYGDLHKIEGGNGPNSYVGYTERTPGMMRVTIVDHLALLEDTGKGLKATMDLASTFFVRARNVFGETIVAVQQFNTELQTASRERKHTLAYNPTRQDLGDSRYTYRDADVVLGLTRPLDYQLNEVDEYKKLREWGRYFVQLHIMKNRYGSGAGKYVPLFQNYVSGVPEELPTGTGWNALLEDQYINRAKELDALVN